MNEKLIAELKKLANIATIYGEEYRARAYKKAILLLATTDNIDTIGLGPGIMSKVREYLQTGKIAEIERIYNSREYKAHEIFMKIKGVGPATIAAWVKKKIFTLSDLRRAVAKGSIRLNNMQKYGLLYYDDLNTRIPREEVTELGALVKRELLKIDSAIIFNIAGSYRRGQPTSSDIDILISNPRAFNVDILTTYIGSSDPNIVAVISIGPERLTFLYMGPTHCVRQIDILNLPYANYWAGLLYFTGSMEMNLAMREYAKARGYKLNQHGLIKLPDQPIIVNSEADIFKALGLQYIDPRQRNEALIIPV